jgi:hypothetical protein
MHRNGKNQKKYPKKLISDLRPANEVFNRHAKLGCVAAMLGPKHKIGKYLQKAGVSLPADIHIEEWDAFHDFIVLHCVGLIDPVYR